MDVVRRSSARLALLVALLVVPIVGTSAQEVGAATVAGGFEGVTPTRLLDTREPGQGPCLSAGVPRSLTVAGVGGVAADAAAVVLNVTATAPTGAGYVTVFPTGVARPNASNLNFVAGQTVPNAVTVKVGTGGQVELFNSSGCTHLVVDVVGYYTGGGPVGLGGFAGITPTRILDSRNPSEGPCLEAGLYRLLDVIGLADIPLDATAAVLNVTATAPTANGFLTVFPGLGFRPDASNLNFVAGQTVPNAVTVKLTNGFINVMNSAGCTHVVIDVVGYFSGAGGDGGFNGVDPTRLLDTRTALQGPCLPGGTPRELTVAGVGPVDGDATAVVLNVTVTEPSGNGWLTVYPSGVARPNASNLNYVGGQTVPNAVTVKVGAGGKITLFGSAACAHVIIDVVGYFGPGFTISDGDCLSGMMDLKYYGPIDTVDNAALFTSMNGTCTGSPSSLTVIRAATSGDAATKCQDLTGAPSYMTLYGLFTVPSDLFACFGSG